jgi:hypothetical protein
MKVVDYNLDESLLNTERLSLVYIIS